MKRITKILTTTISAWVCLFLAISALAYSRGEIAYSGGEWYVSFGYPHWLTLDGDNGIGGWRNNLEKGTWNISFSYLAIALTISFVPIVCYLTVYLLIKGELRFHLMTAIGLAVASGILLWANIGVDRRFDTVHSGWPLSVNGNPYRYEGLVSDVSVAIVILFFTGLAFEWSMRYRINTISERPVQKP